LQLLQLQNLVSFGKDLFYSKKYFLSYAEKYASTEMYMEGDVICHQDDIADGLYYIVEGSVAVSAKSSNGEKHLATLQKGSLLGEIALVSQSRRTATVTAVQRCQVLKMEKENFTRFLGIFPQLQVKPAYRNTKFPMYNCRRNRKCFRNLSSVVQHQV